MRSKVEPEQQNEDGNNIFWGGSRVNYCVFKKANASLW